MIYDFYTASSTTSNSVFGGFGSNASSANPSPVFGNPAPTTASTTIPNFGTTASTPFGSQNQQQGAAAPAFGAATTGTPFGGSPAPTFGAGSTPAFGAGSAAPAFGNNATSTPAFGNANATQQNAGELKYMVEVNNYCNSGLEFPQGHRGHILWCPSDLALGALLLWP